MRTLATTLLIASPWLALITLFAALTPGPPRWYLAALAAAVLVAAAVLAGLARTIAHHDRRPR